MMLGEEDTSVEDERAFGKKMCVCRMAVIFADPFFNFCLAFLFAIIVIGTIGYDPAKVTEVTAGSSAAEAGLQSGDVITSINDTKIVVNREVSYYTVFHPFSSEPVTMTVNRQGQEKVLTMTPKETTVNGKKVYRCGLPMGHREKK